MAENRSGLKYSGVTFANLRAALCATYFLKNGMSVSEWKRSLRYVVPSQHNWENPIKAQSQDTWIQYWIDSDDRLSQDYNAGEINEVMKTARVTLRFLGAQAEMWAKAFHHLTKRKSVADIFYEYCQAHILEYVSPIMPINVDYFAAGNTTIAFDLTFELQYLESIELGFKPLECISMPPGEALNIEGNIT